MKRIAIIAACLLPALSFANGLTVKGYSLGATYTAEMKEPHCIAMFDTRLGRYHSCDASESTYMGIPSLIRVIIDEKRLIRSVVALIPPVQTDAVDAQLSKLYGRATTARLHGGRTCLAWKAKETIILRCDPSEDEPSAWVRYDWTPTVDPKDV